MIRICLQAGLLFCLTPLAASATECCIFLQQPQLLQVKAQTQGDANYRLLMHDADSALQKPLLSVTDKGLTPPSGDKHDYLSLGVYWWPDASKDNGLPWIRRDGQVNPASKNEQSDGVRLAEFTQRVQTLALAGYFSGQRRYSDRAIELIRTWFINPATRMNPNLTYAQGIPGRDNGRGNGILDGRYFATRIVDSLLLLQQTPGWTPQDESQLRQWFGRYLDWLLHSPAGKQEAAAKNNHGSWYAVQVAGIATWLGRDQVVRDMATLTQQKLDLQLAVNGSQPQELLRTRSFHYSYFNLQALVLMAGLAQRQGIDLWHYRTEQGSSLLAALDFMAPYVDVAQPWPYPSLDRVGVRIVPLMIQADSMLKTTRYQAVIKKAQFNTAQWQGKASYVRGAVKEAQRQSWLEAGREPVAPR
ncbi:poly(beta-D-mannuronate) lyase [Serratia quinivorans]|nr:poly(beta-D-mannuronate) lyase [Serratia quinivorans]CAI0809584.1 poly(beta-D-mannuronate) lyase [Serratia quinivorans]CAI1601188.1 poly(beta-D-mannuronate) lyase [Serratia quinivorans]CAI2059901.1 poly(beta-D-mannuronate) lyase [Serratia quinivorans]CAI2403565.1 poly(beta-D-mannuronate) lyase [Serratia quinivorans]